MTKAYENKNLFINPFRYFWYFCWHIRRMIAVSGLKFRKKRALRCFLFLN